MSAVQWKWKLPFGKQEKIAPVDEKKESLISKEGDNSAVEKVRKPLKSVELELIGAFFQDTVKFDVQLDSSSISHFGMENWREIASCDDTKEMQFQTKTPQLRRESLKVRVPHLVLALNSLYQFGLTISKGWWYFVAIHGIVSLYFFITSYFMSSPWTMRIKENLCLMFARCDRIEKLRYSSWMPCSTVEYLDELLGSTQVDSLLVMARSLNSSWRDAVMRMIAVRDIGKTVIVTRSCNAEELKAFITAASESGRPLDIVQVGKERTDSTFFGKSASELEEFLREGERDSQAIRIETAPDLAVMDGEGRLPIRMRISVNSPPDLVSPAEEKSDPLTFYV